MNMSDYLAAMEASKVTPEVTVLKGEPKAGETATLGHRFIGVHYNTDAKTGIKSKSIWLQVPAFRPELGLGLSRQGYEAIYGAIDKMQHAAVKDWIDSSYDPDLLDAVSDCEAMFTEWNTDGRGERDGVKQSVVLAWITGEFAGYLKARLEKNEGMVKEQKASLLEYFVRMYKLAATRGNKGKDKQGNATFVSLMKLKDLESRLQGYLTCPTMPLASGEVSKCLIERIAGHIAVLEASVKDDEEITAKF